MSTPADDAKREIELLELDLTWRAKTWPDLEPGEAPFIIELTASGTFSQLGGSLLLLERFISTLAFIIPNPHESALMRELAAARARVAELEKDSETARKVAHAEAALARSGLEKNTKKGKGEAAPTPDAVDGEPTRDAVSPSVEKGA